MGRIVMKFGGSAMASVEQILALAPHIAHKKGRGEEVVVIVSAMGKMTDDLLHLASQVHSSPPERELDMLVSVGERVSMSLLTMALDRLGVDGVSFTGSQAGIITTEKHTQARIVDVRPHRIEKNLSLNKVVIVAGFQGVSRRGEITTLGRGGSDTSAVALGIALGAEWVEFYKDVPGIGHEDPKRAPGTPIYSNLSYEKALAIIGEGAEVLHDRCLFLAHKAALPLHIIPFDDLSASGTWIGGKACGAGLFKYECDEVSHV